MVSEGLAGADDVVQRAWARLAIPPAEWACEGAPDGERFWVVGTIPGTEAGAAEIVWYNHIEEGFNQSPSPSPRIIGEYRCNQRTFAELLAGLPEALEAATFAQDAPDDVVPACLCEGGHIERRQTTYWDLVSRDGSPVRVHFAGVAERRFDGPAFASIGLYDEHEVLAHHHEPSARVIASGMREVQEAVREALAVYLEGDPGLLRRRAEYVTAGMLAQVEDGFGCILQGPEPVAREVAAVVQRAGAVASVIAHAPSGARYRALVLGRSFIVAGAFRFSARAASRTFR